MLNRLESIARLTKLLGLPQADYTARNEQLEDILKLSSIEFVPPTDDGTSHELKGSASLCANFAVLTLMEFAPFWIAVSQHGFLESLEVHCARRFPTKEFPFFMNMGSKAAAAFQNRLAMHRHPMSKGEPYIPSITGRNSFRMFWATELGEVVFTQNILMKQEVEYLLKMKGLSADPLTIRAGLMVAILAYLNGKAPEGAVAEAWESAGLSASKLNEIITNWRDAQEE
jgi:hypothetical protein